MVLLNMAIVQAQIVITARYDEAPVAICCAAPVNPVQSSNHLNVKNKANMSHNIL